MSEGLFKASPPGPDVPEVVSGTIITSAWGSSVADDLTELWGQVTDLHGQVDALPVDQFTATTPGIVPASGGGTANFMRADGVWGPAPQGIQGPVGPPADMASNAETVAGAVTSKAVTPAGLAYERPYLDVRTYGAKGDNLTDDTAAIQAAIDALPSTGGTIMFPGGTYIANGLILKNYVNLRGVGSASSRLRAKTSDLISVPVTVNFVTIVDLGFLSDGPGHIFNFASGSGISQSQIERCQFQQNGDATSVVNMPNGSWIDMLVQGCSFQHTATATVPTFNLIAGTNFAINSNTWRRCRFTFSGNYSIWIECQGSATFCFDNTIQDVNFEVTVGGAVKLLSTNSTLLSQCAVYDLQLVGPTTRDLFSVGKSAAGGSLSSRFTTFDHVSRRGGTLGAGLFDVKLIGGGATTTMYRMSNLGSSQGLVRDNGSTSVVDIGNNSAGATQDAYTTYLTGITTRTGAWTTANRPAAATYGQGAQFYDTTLKRPIWSDGTTWRDAAGTAV